MQRKPGFPVANCSIKMPECTVMPEPTLYEEDNDQQQRRQQLINFGHSQWGFNNWSWSVSKQELDFVDFTNGKYSAGVVAFVSITVKTFDIHRENIGYATSVANTKGFAIYKSRKCAVTNALRETLLSFGGNVATQLTELLESSRGDTPQCAPANAADLENNQNVANKPSEPKNMGVERAARKDSPAAPLAASPATPLAAFTGAPLVASPGAPPAAPAPPAAAPAPPAVKNARVLATSLPPANRVPPRPPAPPGGSVPPGVGGVPPGVGGVPPGVAGVPPGVAGVPRPNSNEPALAAKSGLEGLSEEEARAERKRRQRLAQEEFRQKQVMKQLQQLGKAQNLVIKLILIFASIVLFLQMILLYLCLIAKKIDDKQDLSRNSSSFDKLLMDIPTQDIVIEATGEKPTKRKSPGPDGAGAAKRRNSCRSKLDIVQTD